MNADVKGESEPPDPWEREEARGKFFGGHPPPPRHRQGEQHEAAEAEKGTNADFEPNVLFDSQEELIRHLAMKQKMQKQEEAPLKLSWNTKTGSYGLWAK